MKKRFILCLLLVALLVAAALPVGAVVKGVEIFEEYGTTYAWVIGEPVMPDDPPEDHHWEAVMDAEGFQVTEVGQCEYYGKNHVHSWDCWDPVTYEEICGMVAHSCNINCITDNIKYKYVLVEDKKEPVLLIVGRGPEGEAVLDCEYVLLKQEVKTDQYGQYVLDLEGNLQWSTERVSQDAKLNENGVAALLLDKKKLDQTADYAKLIVGQVLKGDAAETYRPLAKRWQVTVRKNAQGKYELYSITEAPGVNPKKPEDLPQDYFALGQPGFETVADYFNEATKTLTVVNEYYLGTIGLNIEFEGFGSVVPNEAAGAVSIVDGPTVFGEKFTKDTTLKNVHMGTYHVVADPVEVPGYGLEDIRIQVQAPVEAPPVDYGDALVLSKNSANAVVTVTYTYKALHDHDFEETVVKPTCTDEGYTLVTCKDPTCPYRQTKDEVPALGHDYVKTVTEPTCTQSGGLVEVCSRCGDRKEGAGEPATGHSYQRAEFAPTCTENGYTLFTCGKCGDSYREAGEPASGHKTTSRVVEPTCTEKGHTLHQCGNCSYSYITDEKDALGHRYVSQVIEPTAQREGYTLHTCSVCGDMYTDNHQDKLTNDGAVATDPKNTVIGRVVDEDDKPLLNSEVTLYDGKTKLKTWKHTYENLLVLDSMEQFAKEEESVTYTLKQTKAPDGYAISADSFTVKISNREGKTEVDVKKNTGGSVKGNGIEVGTDGKQVITFRNSRKTTQIELICRVNVEFDQRSWVDEALIAEYQQKQQEFLLTWKDKTGAEQTESVALAHGEIGSLGAKLPYDTQYTITFAGEADKCAVTFSENASGTITQKQTKEPVTVEVELLYTVNAEKLQLSLVVVDEENKRPLEGATFDLRNPDGLRVGTYTSRENGQILIAEVFEQPGEYLLTQMEAPEGYDALEGAVPLTVTVGYAAGEDTEDPLYVQSMSAQAAHQAVVKESDGSFWIENARNGTGDYGDEGGLGLWAILGIVAAAVLAVAAVVIVVLILRKRRKA